MADFAHGQWGARMAAADGKKQMALAPPLERGGSDNAVGLPMSASSAGSPGGRPRCRPDVCLYTRHEIMYIVGRLRWGGMAGTGINVKDQRRGNQGTEEMVRPFNNRGGVTSLVPGNSSPLTTPRPRPLCTAFCGLCDRAAHCPPRCTGHLGVPPSPVLHGSSRGAPHGVLHSVQLQLQCGRQKGWCPAREAQLCGEPAGRIIGTPFPLVEAPTLATPLFTPPSPPPHLSCGARCSSST